MSRLKEAAQKWQQLKDISTNAPPLSIQDYFVKNYFDILNIVKLVGQANPNLDKNEWKKIAYKEIIEIAYEDGIRTIYGNHITHKQVNFFLVKAKEIVTEQIKQKKLATAPEASKGEVVEPPPIEPVVVSLKDLNELSEDEVSNLTKADIGWSRSQFEKIADEYYNEHPKFWKWKRELQYVVAWLKADCPNIADAKNTDNLKGSQGWTYAQFWNEYQIAKRLRFQQV